MADKHLIARYLERQPDRWVAPAEIRAAIPDVPDRTLRRWLTQLIEDGAIQGVGDRKGRRYRWTAAPATSAARPRAGLSSDRAERETAFTAKSVQLLRRIEAPLYTRPPVSYSEQWVARYIPNRSYYLSAAQRRQLQNGKRPGIQDYGGTYVQKIFNRLLVDLSYNSARLEGNTYTLGETERLLLRGVSAEGRLDAERIMILNHKEAIRYLVEHSSTISPDEETIRTLHYLLADSLVAPGMAGQIRDESIRISGTTYAPLEGRARLTRLLTGVLSKARRIEDPFEQSFFLLGHISYLQAFVDVNKRTARLASIIPLIRNDYVPQSFIDVDKNDYLKALICFYELNEHAPLADLYCWSYRRSCQHYDTSAEVVAFDEIAARYRQQRRALVAEVVRSKTKPADLRAHLRARIPKEVQRQHRAKFLRDVLDELEHLDVARAAGLGVTRAEVEAWARRRAGARGKGTR